MEAVRQLVDGGFHREDPLGRPVSPVGACRHPVGIHHIVGKPMRLQPSVQGDGFVTGKPHRGGTVFPVCPGIGQGIEIDAPDPSVLHRPYPNRHFHLMAWAGCDLGLLSGVNDLGGFSGLPGDKCRVDLRHHRLFCPKASSDTGFADPDFGLWNPQGIGDNTAYMEDDLRGTEEIQLP